MKSWLGCVVVFASSVWSRHAAAALDTTQDPIPVGDVVVLQTGTAGGTITSDGADTLDHFSFSNTTSCTRFTITPAAPLPRLINGGMPLDITVSFTPSARGAASPVCIVTMRDAANVALGTFSVTGTGIAPVIGFPSSQSFGSVRVANAAVTTASRTIVIANNGDTGQDLVVSSYSIGGTDAGDWTITNTPATTIAPGTSTNVIVRFDPSMAGPRSATLDLASNDPLTPMASVSLTGSGTNAVIAVTDRAFGVVPITTVSASTITVSNEGATPQGPLHVTSAAISGGSGWFTFDTNGASNCLGLATCTFAGGGFDVPPSTAIGVRCQPPAGATGSQTATVAIASDTDGGGDNMSSLTCTAGRADIALSTTMLAFDDVLVPTSSTPLGVNITNNGNLELVVNASKSGARQAEYALGGCVNPCNVPAGMTRSFTVTFTPLTPGSAPITISLASNDPDDASVDITVTGRGVAPQISAPMSLAFSTVEVGKVSGTQTLTATNTGTSTLTITNASFFSGGSDYSALSGTTGPQLTMVAPGGMVSWGIVCNPSTHGMRPGTFQIISNSFIGATTNVSLTCNGQQGVLATSVPTINFGAVPQGGNVPVMFTLRNTGNVTVSNIMPAIDPSNVGYSLDAGTPMTLVAGGSIQLTARFQPMSGADGGPATLTFTGSWGVTPTTTTAAIALDGDGLTAGYDVTPATVDFGNLRFDTTPTRTFCIVNTQQASLAIQGTLMIAPGPGTMTGEFAVTQIRRQPVCGGTPGATVSLPQTLASNELLEVVVRADPANRTGPMNATLTVTSNLTMNPTRTVTLAGNSTSAMIAVTPPGGMVDFGAVDVQGPPVTRDLTITNTGDAALDLATFARTIDPQFTFTLPGATTLQPTQTLTIAITYRPVAAAPVGSEETVTLTHSIAGVLGSPGMGTAIIRGRGIDRNLMLGITPTFPDTFRNPGDRAPVGAMTIQNLGEAVLKVSSLMLTDNEPDWAIVDATPVDVPHMGRYDVLVRFSPTLAGRTTATLQILNDDDSKPMINVSLVGMGRDRNVMFGPDVIRLGYTGVGVPVTIPDALVVASMDAVNGFTIRSIELEEGTPFAIEGVTTNVELAPQGLRTYGVTFTPVEPGPFQARVSLYLDQDPESHHDVMIEGQAVFVDAHGGGGCATGGGTGGGAVVLLGLLALRRRRAVVLAVALAPLAARADNVALSVFDPTPATTTDGFQLQSPVVGASGEWVASAVVSHAMDPLILDGLDEGRFVNDTGVVRRSTLVDVGVAVAFLDRFEAGVRMPLYAQDGDPYGDPIKMFTTRPAEGAARGDLTLHGKVRLWRRPLEGRGALHLGAAVGVTLPTASDGQFTGLDRPSARTLLLGSLVPGAFDGRVTVSLNAGAILRATSSYANLEQRSGIAWGVGASVRALDPLWVAAELYGDTVPGGRSDAMGGSSTLAPVEWLAGIRWRPDHRFAVGLAGGRGLTSAAGAPAFRAVLALTIAPGAPELRPIHAPRPEEPDGDLDRDGVRDRADRCPREAEDLDLFDDGDGCPDLDNDLDAIADEVDKCPLEPEDKDSFEDEDGCPDKDNDGDAVADAVDKCPVQPEDKDGFQDLDGCPELDNDKDGLTDDKDRCPMEPETINGNKDDDGCPDKGDGVVVLSPDRVEMLDAIQFNGTRIARQSFNVLGQIAATLRAHPEIVRLRVTSHVQPTPNIERDQDITTKRAQAVRDWLVQWGIEASRVELRGFGGTKPIAKVQQKGSAQLNDRIEFIILERK